MHILNQTGYPAQFTMGMDKAGHEYAVLVVKGTFDFPEEPGGAVRISEEQAPLVMADEATGAPGYSAIRWETDFAFRKPRCDIVLNGSAHAPGGRPAERVRVGLKVGGFSKVIDVVGHREWRSRGPLVVATAPQPFLTQPITYDVAFGGVDRLDPDDKLQASYPLNPVGTGWARPKNQARIDGLALPRTEAPSVEVRTPYGDYRPMAFGPWGRGWPGRIEHGGTYDDRWAAEVFPFLPADFDERYFQMAPEDQQVASPVGGEEVMLVNLTPSGREQFRLPSTALPLVVFRGRSICFKGDLHPDTLLFDADSRRFSLVWRIAERIHRTILDITEAWVGPPTPSMVRAWETGRGFVRVTADTGPPTDEEPVA
jgi:hypothetical protein